jgi:hypothetical protein
MGSILNTAFGWATLMLFGRTPRKRRTALSIVSLGSVLWIIALLGVLSPSIASFLLAFITVPEFLEKWMRALMILLVATIPLGVGALTRHLHPGARAARGPLAQMGAVLRGYPYTIGFGLTLVLLVVLVPLVRARDVARGWATTHIPVIVEADDYHSVVTLLRRALRERGIDTRLEPVSWVLRLPTRVLAFFAGRTIDGLVAQDMKSMRAEGLEILLHPSDLVVGGRPERTAAAAAILLECLIYTKAHLTWDEESHRLEDRLQSILHETLARRGPRSASSSDTRLRTVEREIRQTHLPYEEIEKLFRIKLQVETEVLRAALEPMV